MDIIEILSPITKIQINCHVAIICAWNLGPEGHQSPPSSVSYFKI